MLYILFAENVNEKDVLNWGSWKLITLFLLSIVCVAIINLYDPSVRDFEAISIYTLFGCQTVPSTHPIHSVILDEILKVKESKSDQ